LKSTNVSFPLQEKKKKGNFSMDFFFKVVLVYFCLSSFGSAFLIREKEKSNFLRDFFFKVVLVYFCLSSFGSAFLIREKEKK